MAIAKASTESCATQLLNGEIFFTLKEAHSTGSFAHIFYAADYTEPLSLHVYSGAMLGEGMSEFRILSAADAFFYQSSERSFTLFFDLCRPSVDFLRFLFSEMKCLPPRTYASPNT